MKKRSEEARVKKQETVFKLLSEKDGNEMQLTELAEMVDKWFKHSVSGKALGLFLRTQVRKGYITKQVKRLGGKQAMYWKLECEDLDLFLEKEETVLNRS
jgi:hypothetical protein